MSDGGRTAATTMLGGRVGRAISGLGGMNAINQSECVRLRPTLEGGRSRVGCRGGRLLGKRGRCRNDTSTPPTGTYRETGLGVK